MRYAIKINDSICIYGTEALARERMAVALAHPNGYTVEWIGSVECGF